MSETCLVFHESIPKSANNVVLSIPDLTNRGLVLGSIHFETADWFFEASLRSGAGELMKMSVAYFKHLQEIDLEGMRAKIDEGDRLELVIKPKQSPRKIDLMICYNYVESRGAVYYQSQDTLVNLPDSKILVDITQGNVPTELSIRCDEDKIKGVRFEPTFTGSGLGVGGSVEVKSESGNGGMTIDFTQDRFQSILPMLRYYDLKIDMDEGADVNSNVYFLARGFKN